MSQSCSPPVTSIESASVTSLVCSGSQYGHGSSKCITLLSSNNLPISIACIDDEKQLFASTNFFTELSKDLLIVLTISSVLPSHSSKPLPHSAPILNLNASMPLSSNKVLKRLAS